MDPATFVHPEEVHLDQLREGWVSAVREQTAWALAEATRAARAANLASMVKMRLNGVLEDDDCEIELQEFEEVPNPKII